LLLLLLLELELLDGCSGPLLHGRATAARSGPTRRCCCCRALGGLDGLHLAELGGRHATATRVGCGGRALGEGREMGGLLLSRRRRSRNG